MNKPYVLSIAAALAVGGGLTAMGVALAEDESEARVVVASTPLEEAAPVQRVDYDNIPGMAMGAPPGSAQMLCSDPKNCTLVFIAPTDEVVKPFGLKVKLLKATAKRVTISVDGRKQSVVPGKTEAVEGAKVKLVGTPGTVVTLNFAKK
ncbi:MAG: hypothetical protein ACT4QF_11355 [Sporichthyaceae bacterium]